MNKLYNDTAVQAIANAIRAKNGSSDTYTIAEMSAALNDLSYYAKPSISNVALATFEADGLPLNSLKVSVEAKQEGSGTPSPENVRPISGWSEVKVSDVDDVDNPTVTQTTTIPLPQTVYGGEVDVVNGVSGNKITYDVVDMGSLTWYYSSGQRRFSTPSLVDVIKPSSGRSAEGLLCSCFECTIDGTDSFLFQSGTSIYVYASDYTDASAFTAAVTGQTLRYELATPTTFTTSPTPVKSLEGTNNLSVDCGEVIELEYFKEV